MFQHVCSYHRARVQDILVYIAKTPSPVRLHRYHERYKGWVHFCSRRLEILGPGFLLATYRNFSPEPPQLSAPSLVPVISLQCSMWIADLVVNHLKLTSEAS